jgi:hypothetical protein
MFNLIADANAPAVEYKPTDVAVTINGVNITEGEVDEAAAPQIEKMVSGSSQIPPAFLETLKKQARTRTLERMIVEKLLDQEIGKEKIVVTEDTADS